MQKTGVKSSSGMSADAAKETTEKVLKAVGYVRKLQALQTPFSQRFGGKRSFFLCFSLSLCLSFSSYVLCTMNTNEYIRECIKLLGKAETTAFSSLLTSAQSMASSTLAKAASFFAKFASLYVTKVVENLAEGRQCTEDDTFCTLDPRSRQGDVVDFKGNKYSEVIVFVMGGGCYSEFFNLQDLLKHKASSSSILRNVLYGSTEIVSGDDFQAQLQKLGK